MNVLDSYKIDLKNMRTGVAEYRFKLDHTFFDAVEGTLVKNGNVDVDLKARETGGDGFIFTFQIKGTVHVPCDRCLEDMEVEIDSERKLTVTLGDEYADDGELITLPYEDAVIDVAWIIYEFIVLEVPITHMHEPGSCNASMMEALTPHLVAQSEGDDRQEGDAEDDEDHIDPRWSELKKILDNN